MTSARLTRREGDALEGARCWFPIPCNEFIEAFLCKVGVEDLVSWLIELGLLCKGLREGNLPFGDDVLSKLLCCVKARAGEEGSEDEGKAIEEAALMESFWRVCEREFVDGGNGALSMGSFPALFPGEYDMLLAQLYELACLFNCSKCYL